MFVGRALRVHVTATRRKKSTITAYLAVLNTQTLAEQTVRAFFVGIVDFLTAVEASLDHQQKSSQQRFRSAVHRFFSVVLCEPFLHINNSDTTNFSSMHVFLLVA